MPDVGMDAKPDDRQSYVASIIEREAVDAKAAEERRTRTKRSSVPLALIVIPLALLLTVWNMVAATRTVDTTPRQDPPAATTFAIHVGAMAIDAYRDSVLTLPPSLETVGIRSDFLTYVPGESTYTLIAEVGDNQITYHSDEELPAFDPVYHSFKTAEHK